jgi:hypothetical protein
MRKPSLETVLAYVVIFKKPGRELFAGLYQKIKRRVAERAKTLANKVERQKSGRQIALKLKALASIIDAESN